MTDKSPLRQALNACDLKKVRELVAAGDNIRFVDDHGYNAAIDAAYGVYKASPEAARQLFEYLIEQRVNLSQRTSYGESALSVLSRMGRFEFVHQLLSAGADKRQLKWTPLLEAVALGSVADVESALNMGEHIDSRDAWARTPWLLSLQRGDRAKAELLQAHGADTSVRGHCGAPCTFYPIRGGYPDMLRWLLQSGVSTELKDDFGHTAIFEAVGHDNLECVLLLLEAGCDIHIDANGTPLSGARSRPIIMRLLEAGADPADADQRIILGFDSKHTSRERTLSVLASVTPDDFTRGINRIFGRSNPERMHQPYWEAMIRAGAGAYAARVRFGRTDSYSDGPIWCAERYGQSLTLLPDGRAIQVGGEHEDFYSSDFCIYNDIFVHYPDGEIEVYGYPKEVFPPTDFHTATLVGDHIYLIGSTGYQDERQYGETQVLRLNIHSLRIDSVETSGEKPGWISCHRAKLADPSTIRVWGGKIMKLDTGEESFVENRTTFLLDLNSMRWRVE